VANADTVVSHEDIEQAVEEIVRQFAPERVLLFGSYAYGEPTPDSDVDLLVTMDMDVRPVDQAVAIRQAVRFPFPLDLLVRTPQQIEERLQLNDPFFKEVLTRGVLLYEATNTGVGREGRRRSGSR
jgi:predicted nucleotidyltransferase